MRGELLPVFQGAVESVTDTMKEPEGPVFAHMASADQGNLLDQAVKILLARSVLVIS
jgi:hypothetical protein